MFVTFLFQALASFILYCESNADQDLQVFYSDALSFLFYINAFRKIHQFILRTIKSVRRLTIEFIIDIIEFLFANNLDPRCYLSGLLIDDEVAKSNIFFKKTPTVRFLLSILSFSYGDHIRIRDYGQKHIKGIMSSITNLIIHQF